MNAGYAGNAAKPKARMPSEGVPDARSPSCRGTTAETRTTSSAIAAAPAGMSHALPPGGAHPGEPRRRRPAARRQRPRPPSRFRVDDLERLAEQPPLPHPVPAGAGAAAVVERDDRHAAGRGGLVGGSRLADHERGPPAGTPRARRPARESRAPGADATNGTSPAPCPTAQPSASSRRQVARRRAVGATERSARTAPAALAQRAHDAREANGVVVSALAAPGQQADPLARQRRQSSARSRSTITLPGARAAGTPCARRSAAVRSSRTKTRARAPQQRALERAVGRDVRALRRSRRRRSARAAQQRQRRARTSRRPRRRRRSRAPAARRKRSCAKNSAAKPAPQVARERAHVAHRDEAAARHRAARPDLAHRAAAESFADERKVIDPQRRDRRRAPPRAMRSRDRRLAVAVGDEQHAPPRHADKRDEVEARDDRATVRARPANSVRDANAPYGPACTIGTRPAYSPSRSRVVAMPAQDQVEPRHGGAEPAIGPQPEVRERDQHRVVGRFARRSRAPRRSDRRSASRRAAPTGSLADTARRAARRRAPSTSSSPSGHANAASARERQRPAAQVDQVRTDQRMVHLARARRDGAEQVVELAVAHPLRVVAGRVDLRDDRLAPKKHRLAAAQRIAAVEQQPRLARAQRAQRARRVRAGRADRRCARRAGSRARQLEREPRAALERIGRSERGAHLGHLGELPARVGEQRRRAQRRDSSGVASSCNSSGTTARPSTMFGSVMYGPGQMRRAIFTCEGRTT